MAVFLFLKTLKSFAQAFSKACRSRATPLSLSAESETPLGEAQHSFTPKRWTKSIVFLLMLFTKEKAADKIRRSKSKECWASPKGISLSAESDKGVALDL